MSFPGSGPSLRNDRRGSVHMMEVMIVGIMVMGSIMAVSSIQSGMERSGQQPVRGHEDRAQDVLDVLRGLPATNTSVHFSHGLEEAIVHNLTEGDGALARTIRAHYAADNRLVLQNGQKEVLVLGPADLPVQDMPDGASSMWHSRLGATLIRPLVSHQDTQMDGWFQLLPVWADRVPRPAGHPMQVDLDLDGDVDHNLSQVFFHRLPLSGQHPLVMEPISAGGTPQWVVQETDVTNGTEYEWEVNVRLAPTDADRVWLAQGEVFEVIPPSGSWSLSGKETDWEDVSAAGSPVVKMEYQGSPRRGDAEAWLNVTFQRPTSDPLTGIELLRVRTSSHLGGEVHVALTPSQVDRPAPVGVMVSQPSPFSAQAELPLTFTLTNPTDESLLVERFSVDFEAGHQFAHEPADWMRTVSGDRVVYEYSGPSVNLPAGGAKTVELPVRAADAQEGDNVRRDLPPVLEYLGEGRLEPPARDGYLPSSSGDTVPRSVGLPHGDRLYLARLAGDGMENGTHTVRVGHFADDQVPPGVGSYERLNESSGGLFPALLETRSTMSLGHDGTLRPEKGLTVTLDLGRLRSFLDEHAGQMSGEPVRVEVRAGDLMETLTGAPEVVHSENHEHLDLQDDMERVVELEFARSASMGPVVVDAKVVVPTLEHGEAELHFLSHAMRTPNGEEAVPVFLTAHLQYWHPGAAEVTT